MADEKVFGFPIKVEDNKIKTPKGVCQFCNPKSIYFIKRDKLKNI